MDHQDGISRRDAVIGVSFLSILLALLSATIVYRILESKNGKGPRMSAPLIAAAPAGEATAETTTTSAAMFDGEIETVALETPVTDGAAVQSGGVPQPTFVAPSGR